MNKKYCFSHLFSAFVALFLCLSASAQDAPLMGWSSWNTFGFLISDDIICGQADAMVKTGLKDAGYSYINIDDGYFGGRDEEGRLLIHPTRFPKGMRPVVDYIHSKGLKAGIYSDAGRNTCASYFGGDTIGVGVGLYGHDKEDCLHFFKELDFDFIKVDFCGGSAGHNKDRLRLDEQVRYTDIVKAIQAAGKPGVRINVCRWDYPGTWVSSLCESWRTTHDIACHWGNVADIIKQNLYMSAYSSKGHFNDMDMLEVGRGLSIEEDKTHFALWCIMNSPLLVGCDMNKVKPEPLALMANRRLIALNQDPVFQQAYPAQYINGCYVIVKDLEKLEGTKRAVAIYNPSNEAKSVELNLKDIDLRQPTRIIELFSGDDVTATAYKQARLSVADPAAGNRRPGGPRRIKAKPVMSDLLQANDIPAHGTAIFTIEAEERLPREFYEAETAYNPSYQELRNNQSERTGWYEYSDSCRSGMKASWLGMNEDNCLIFRQVSSKEACDAELTIAFLSGEDRYLTVEVNGEKVQRVTCNSGSFQKVGTVQVPIRLRKGNNEIRLHNNATYMPDVDYIRVVRM